MGIDINLDEFTHEELHFILELILKGQQHSRGKVVDTSDIDLFYMRNTDYLFNADTDTRMDYIEDLLFNLMKKSIVIKTEISEFYSSLFSCWELEFDDGKLFYKFDPKLINRLGGIKILPRNL